MSLRQTCDSCERSFDSLLKKKIHEQQIHVYIHQCEECSIKFKSLDDLQKHKESAHTSTPPVKKTRERKKSRKTVKKKTVLNVVPVVAFDCSQCDELFRSEDELRSHEREYHGCVEDLEDSEDTVEVTPVVVVDTASQTVFSQDSEDDIISSQNFKELSDKVSDFKNLKCRQEFLLLKLEKLVKHQQSLVEPTGLHISDEDREDDQMKEDIIVDKVEIIPEPEDEIKVDDWKEEPPLVVTEKEPDVKNLKLKIKCEKKGESFKRNICSKLSKKEYRKERKRIKKLKKKLIKEAERDRLELEGKRKKDSEGLNKVETKIAKRGRETEGLEEETKAKKKRIYSCTPTGDVLDQEAPEVLKPDKKIVKKERESLNFETLEYKREKVREMEAQREKLRQKLLEVMRKKSVGKSTDGEKPEYTNKAMDDHDDDFGESCVQDEPFKERPFTPIKKLEQKENLKESYLDELSEEVESADQQSEKNEHSVKYLDEPSADVDSVDQQSKEHPKLEEDSQEVIEKSGTKRSVDVFEKRVSSIFDIDNEFESKTNSPTVEVPLECSEIDSDETSLDYDGEDESEEENYVLEENDDMMDISNIGNNTSDFSEENEDSVVEEGIYQDFAQYQSVSSYVETVVPEPSLQEEGGGNLANDFQQCTLEEKSETDNFQPTYDPDVIYSHHSTEVVKEVERFEEIPATIQTENVQNERIFSEKKRTLVEEPDHGFFELLSDSDDEESYLEFKLKTAVYFTAPGQSSSRIFTANFDEVLSDSEEDDQEEEEEEEEETQIQSQYEKPLIQSRIEEQQIQSQAEEPLVQSQSDELLIQSQYEELSIQRQTEEPLIQSQAVEPLIQSQSLELLIKSQMEERLFPMKESKYPVTEELSVSINDDVNAKDEGYVSSPPRKNLTKDRSKAQGGSNWMKDISLQRGWKLKRNGMKLVYKSKEGQIFKSRLEVFKHLLKDRQNAM